MTSGNRSIKLLIDGMTCSNCAKHVDNALQQIKEIHEVMITLKPNETSTVTITLNDDIADEALAASIEEAGYTLVGVER